MATLIYAVDAICDDTKGDIMLGLGLGVRGLAPTVTLMYAVNAML